MGEQGALLQTSDRGGLRIQYSKNPFGKKRDHAGNPVDPVTLPPSTAGAQCCCWLARHMLCPSRALNSVGAAGEAVD